MELIRILKRSLDLDPLALALKVNDIMDRLEIFIQITHKADDPLRLMIFNMLGSSIAFILVYNC